MKLVYIHHSGVTLETKEHIILIDFQKDTKTSYIQRHVLKDKRPLYVLSSHVHADHFNPVVLTWKQFKSNITYIFSKDILEAGAAKPGDAHFLLKGESYTDDLIRVKAFGSTDIGISFLIETEGRKLFHAGDLNNWHWQDESTPEEIAIAEKTFLTELKELSTENPTIDTVLFPVDHRLGNDYMRGAQQFIEYIQTTHFIPIHSWEAYDKSNAFGKQAEAQGVHFIPITHQEQNIEL